MRKFVSLIFVLVLAVSFFSVYISGETPVTVTSAYDDSFGSDNEGKLALTVSNILSEQSLVNIDVSLGLPDGVQSQNTVFTYEVLGSSESFTRDFVLTFEKTSFFEEYGLWLAVGIAIFVVLFVFAGIILRKTKQGKGIVSAILAFVILCCPFASVVSADEISENDETVYNGTIVVDRGRKTYELSVSVSADTATPAKSRPIKNDIPTDPNADYNTPDVDISEVVEGAGPLGYDRVFVGKNDFMFLGQAIPDYTGWNKYEEADLEKLAEMMNERDAWAKENDIDLYFVICPNKSTVYSDYMPERFEKTEYSRCDQVVDYLAEHSDVSVIDLRASLISAREEYGDSLYHPYDTHWTQHGGFVAYTEIMKHILSDNPNAVTYSKNSFNVNYYETYMKDIAYGLGLYDSYYYEAPVYSLKAGPEAVLREMRDNKRYGQFEFAFEWEDGFHENIKYLEFESKNEDAPVLYMMRDSYSMALLPFLKESFSESTFDWVRTFSRSKILSKGTDVVIIQVVEKSLDEILSARTFSG